VSRYSLFPRFLLPRNSLSPEIPSPGNPCNQLIIPNRFGAVLEEFEVRDALQLLFEKKQQEFAGFKFD